MSALQCGTCRPCCASCRQVFRSGNKGLLGGSALELLHDQDPSAAATDSVRARYPCELAGACTPLQACVPEVQKSAHACPPPGELRVVQPPIHPRVRPAENGGKFFVLCFQPVTFPCALCAQVTRASARETMATAHSGSARDRHWKAGPSEPLAKSRHTPPTRATGRRDPARDQLSRACTSLRASLPGSQSLHATPARAPATSPQYRARAMGDESSRGLCTSARA